MYGGGYILAPKTVRASKKFFAQFPDGVREWVKRYAEQARVVGKSVTYHAVSTAWYTITGEGETYRVYYRGKETGARFNNQDALHAGSDMRLNQRITLPIGAWLICYRLFLGKMFFDIYHCVGEPQEALPL
ncbi:MAG: hypothetical protein WC683_10235 [bacterium]